MDDSTVDLIMIDKINTFSSGQVHAIDTHEMYLERGWNFPFSTMILIKCVYLDLHSRFCYWDILVSGGSYKDIAFFIPAQWFPLAMPSWMKLIQNS